MSYKTKFWLLIGTIYISLIALGIDIIMFYLFKEKYFLVLCGLWIVFYLVAYIWFINLKEPPKTKKKKKGDD